MDWIPIGESIPVLTANQERIRDMLRENKSIWYICHTMRMRREHVIDEIYEIRKKEVHMAKKPQSGKLNSQQKAAIYQAWKDGISQADLARQYGVTPASICILIKKLNKAGESIGIKPEREEEEQPAIENNPIEKAAKGLEQIAKTAAQVLGVKQDPEKKPAAINQEFENAIDKMIEDAKAEKKSANVEEKSKIAEVSEPEQDPEPELEDCENGIPNTPLVPTSDALPPVVRRAVDGHLEYLDEKIEALQYRISEIEIEIEEYRKDKDKLQAWKEQQKWR